MITVLGAKIISAVEPSGEWLSAGHSSGPGGPQPPPPQVRWLYWLAGSGLGLVLAVRQRGRRAGI
jgi:MYXO-CTERM domain-containing protein